MVPRSDTSGIHLIAAQTMPNLDEYEKRLRELRQAVDSSRQQPAGAEIESRSAVSDDGTINQTAVAFNVFAKLLNSSGIRPALYSVLRQSDFRFISIFRFNEGMATSSVHVDREDLAVTQAAEVPETATYCHYVRDTQRAFVTADAASDARTENHPSKDVVRSYCGMPILEPNGTLVGVLCLHDLVPREPEKLNLDLLLQVSNALASPGLVPPYPKLNTASQP